MHCFGTGHSRIPVEEMFPRYGSYPGFNPLVELSMTFHTQVVGANGQRQAMFIERVEGLADARSSPTSGCGPTDAMIVFSVGGTTAVPIEMAMGARERGPAGDRRHVGRALARRGRAALLAARGCSTTPTSCSTCARRAGDALVDGRRRRTPVAPGSTVAAVALANAVKVRDGGAAVPSAARCRRCSPRASVVGADESARLFDAAYAEHARRLARTLPDGARDLERRSDGVGCTGRVRCSIDG